MTRIFTFSLQINVIPDRVVIAQSEVILPETLPVGQPYTVQVLPNDRLGRASATKATECWYDLEYFEIFRKGSCTFNTESKDFSFVIQPNVTGTYSLTTYIDKFAMLNHPVQFTVSTSLASYDPSKSTAIGPGAEVAGAGERNTIYLFIRDFYGNVIRSEYHTPVLGYPFWSECGYNYDMLQDGSPTAGYGNPGTWRWSL